MFFELFVGQGRLEEWWKTFGSNSEARLGPVVAAAVAAAVVVWKTKTTRVIKDSAFEADVTKMCSGEPHLRNRVPPPPPPTLCKRRRKVGGGGKSYTEIASKGPLKFLRVGKQGKTEEWFDEEGSGGRNAERRRN